MGLWKRVVQFDTTLRIFWEYAKGLAFVLAGVGLTAWTAVSDNPHGGGGCPVRGARQSVSW